MILLDLEKKGLVNLTQALGVKDNATRIAISLIRQTDEETPIFKALKRDALERNLITTEDKFNDGGAVVEAAQNFLQYIFVPMVLPYLLSEDRDITPEQVRQLIDSEIYHLDQENDVAEILVLRQAGLVVQSFVAGMNHQRNLEAKNK